MAHSLLFMIPKVNYVLDYLCYCQIGMVMLDGNGNDNDDESEVFS